MGLRLTAWSIHVLGRTTPPMMDNLAALPIILARRQPTLGCLSRIGMRVVAAGPLVIVFRVKLRVASLARPKER